METVITELMNTIPTLTPILIITVTVAGVYLFIRFILFAIDLPNRFRELKRPSV